MNEPAIGRETGTAVLKVLPPIAVWVINPPNLLLILSIVYVALQIGFLVFRWRREWVKRGPG